MNYKDRYKQLNKVGEQENILCESCCMDYAVDVHHIKPKSLYPGKGQDDETNLIALCRDCHNMAHCGEISMDQLQLITNERIRLRELGIIRGFNYGIK